MIMPPSKRHVYVIKIPYQDHTEWWISFAFIDPDKDDCFQCPNEKEAHRLANRINAMFE